MSSFESSSDQTREHYAASNGTVGQFHSSTDVKAADEAMQDPIQPEDDQAPSGNPSQRKRKRDNPKDQMSSSSEDDRKEALVGDNQAVKLEPGDPMEGEGKPSHGRKQLERSKDGSPQGREAPQPEGWRVKLYRLNTDGSWDDCGTGRILCLYKQTRTHESNLRGVNWIYHELGEPTLCMHSEVPHPHHTPSPRILLRTRILLRDAYQRQGDNIVTWCEPYMEEGNQAQGVDLALSFQDNAGCLDIWRQITLVQSKAADLFRRPRANQANERGGNPRHQHPSDGGEPDMESGGSVTDVAQAVAAAHHADLQRQQQEEMWVNVASEAEQHRLGHQRSQNGHMSDQDQTFEDAVGMVTGYDTNNSGMGHMEGEAPQSPQLPNPPTLSTLEVVADTIAGAHHIQQREALAMWISQNDGSYLKALLSLFPSAESRGDFASLATLAACVKSILLLNDPSTIELIVSEELMFEEVCATLEYDPDLRDKANHRWFLRERAKFRTVALMEDEDLITAIHRSFRVNYLRDTLLRPTMDESSLSTLSSLQTFTHTDVVKGVTTSPAGTEDNGELLKDSYLAKVIRILGRELDAICETEWESLERLPPGAYIPPIEEQSPELPRDSSTIVSTRKHAQDQDTPSIWKQHLAPQDNSLSSRRIRKRGSLTFLKELFNMVRVSLQQSDKEDFFAVLVSMEVDLSYGENDADHENRSSHGPNINQTYSAGQQAGEQERPTNGSRSRPVNLLSLLGTVLVDPNTDVTEKTSVLEIISGIAMHDPGLIRRRCLDFYTQRKNEAETGRSEGWLGPSRPLPNGKRQIFFQCPANDLLASMCFLLAVETDAGILLQTSEILRVVLDTDVMGDHGPMSPGLADEVTGLPPAGAYNMPLDQHVNPSGAIESTTDQNQFLSMFYEHYIHWLAAPFQHKIVHSIRRVPENAWAAQTPLTQRVSARFKSGETRDEPFLRMVPFSANRSSFAVELLSFCVRAHLYRMKSFLLRSYVLGNVLKLLKPSTVTNKTPGDRCLKLATLRFLRSVLSMHDDFYYRHIIQHNLFAPVFDAFRANPVGDNLVSSAIVEMCDFIHSENIKSLTEYIVTKHLSSAEATIPSLEEVSSPYVNTLTVLREDYEKNRRQLDDSMSGGGAQVQDSAEGTARAVMSEKALEDQRKFRAVDEEESYFDADDDEAPLATTTSPLSADDIAPPGGDNDTHRTPRMFTLPNSN